MTKTSIDKDVQFIPRKTLFILDGMPGAVKVFFINTGLLVLKLGDNVAETVLIPIPCIRLDF